MVISRRLGVSRFLIILALQPSMARAAGYLGVDLYTLQVPTGFTSLGSSSQLRASSGGVVGGGNVSAVPGSEEALVWSTPGGSVTNLNPSGVRNSQAYAISNGQEVGYGSIFEPINNALVWSGTSNTAVDLNPVSAESYAFGTDGIHQVGEVDSGFEFEATLWSGTAASLVNLQPESYVSSLALGVGGGEEVGSGKTGVGRGAPALAMLWYGSASSFVDLSPPGFTSSEAVGTDGQTQVGDGYGASHGRPTHALMWTGTAASVIDLSPASGFSSSYAYAVNGNIEVGYGISGTTTSHALAWNGSAASVIDLQNLLPAGEFTASWAYSVDSAGDIFGVALDTNSIYHAVEWTTVPEPTCIGMACLWLVCTGRRRK